jgi:hypothetical protein
MYALYLVFYILKADNFVTVNELSIVKEEQLYGILKTR